MDKILRQKIENTNFEKLFSDRGFAFFTNGDYNVNIIGIRNLSVPEYNPEKKTLIQTNKFNDYIVLVYKENSKWVRKIFSCTTDPGVKYLLSPLTTLGTAVLIHNRQYRGAYQVGLHQGKYQALVQRKEVTVWRDNTKDNIINLFGKEYSGFYGINLHGAKGAAEASSKDPSQVLETIKSDVIDGYSAGCNVIQYAKQFSEFMKICRKAKDLYGNSFTYTLIDSLSLEGYY